MMHALATRGGVGILAREMWACSDACNDVPHVARVRPRASVLGPKY
jgi:hypothetical protein